MYIDIIKNGLAGSKCEPIIEMAKKMIVNLWNDALNSDEFYTLPLNHLLDIMSRFNWSNLKGDHSRLNQIIQKTDQLGKTMAFIIFGGGKSQTSIESKLKRLQLKNVKYFVFPLLADVYPQIIGACDLGISLFGARNILDLPSELIEMEYSCVPIATFLFGCVREAVSESTGFFFKNEDELIDIIKRVFVSKTVDIGLMRENSKKQLTKWEDSWIEAFSKYFVEEDE